MENDVVFQRRSIRKYQARTVEPEKIERILRADRFDADRVHYVR